MENDNYLLKILRIIVILFGLLHGVTLYISQENHSLQNNFDRIVHNAFT